MSTPHTPGPWHGADKRQRDYTYAICQSGYRVASVHPRDLTRPPFEADPEQDANARLIAASPKLLAALKALRIDANRLCDRQLGGTYENDCRCAIAIADAAIAEAEGAA